VQYEIPDLLSLGENLADGGIRCAIDISDGLLKDLGRILRASRIGAKLDPDKIPVASEAKRIATDKTEALRYALIGGEDYQLLFSFPPVLKPVVKENDCIIIGELTEETEKIQFSPPLPGELKLNKTGYDHFAEQ
jgi:thiamine-monophosphate kinase